MGVDPDCSSYCPGRGPLYNHQGRGQFRPLVGRNKPLLRLPRQGNLGIQEFQGTPTMCQDLILSYTNDKMTNLKKFKDSTAKLLEQQQGLSKFSSFITNKQSH